MALISLMVHVGTMGHRVFVLSVELLQRFHSTKVEVITLIIETVELFGWLIINYPFALLN